MKKQRGVTLMAMLAVLILGAAWWTVTAVSKPVNRTAENRAHNAKVLQQAKAALIGYVTHQTAKSTENDPGSLPCPEAAGNIGTANEGITAPSCTLPAVGRLPWRTLGLDKLRDASGEPLWYVVAPGWAKPNPATNTIINSHCTDPATGLACATGQLTVDATANAAVALIIAPGGPVQVQASANCTARNQTRSLPSPAIDLRDYLECQNATSPADASFATTGPDGSFNDQVLAVTANEVLPIIESAVGARFVREFGPSMRYCGSLWPPCTGAGSAVYLPFAANFGNPAASNYQGAPNSRQGLLPLSFSATGACLANNPVAPYCAPPPACNPALDNRCVPTLVTYRNNAAVITQTGAGSADVVLSNYNCPVAGTPSTLTCTMNVKYALGTPVDNRWITFTLDVPSDNIGMALRQVNNAVQMTGVETAGAGAINPPFGYTVDRAQMNNDGSATVRLTSRVAGASGGLIADLLCGLNLVQGLLADCAQHTITLPFIWVDQPMLYASNATMAWFYRNGWHQLMYYAVAAGNAPSGTGTCAAGTTCLSVFGKNPGNTQRALVVIPGRALGAQVRPPAAVSDWLEGGNVNLPLDSAFWAHDPNLVINRTFNDRIAVIDSN
jgi:hypothetical protein